MCEVVTCHGQTDNSEKENHEKEKEKAEDKTYGAVSQCFVVVSHGYYGTRGEYPFHGNGYIFQKYDCTNDFKTCGRGSGTTSYEHEQYKSG